MAIQEIRVGDTVQDTTGQALFHEIQQTIDVPGLENVRTTKVYTLEGTTEQEAQTLAKKLFAEPLHQVYTINQPLITDATHILHVGYQPGVMNPEVGSIMKSAQDIGVNLAAADSSTEYALYGAVSEEEVQRIADSLVNNTVGRLIFGKPDTLQIQGEVGPVNVIPLRSASNEKLQSISSDRLFLDAAEMQTIQNYFNELGRDPTDVELEIIAGRWSEHCGHKTFKAKVVVDGEEKPPLYSRIKEAASQYFGDEVISAFVDNAGVIRFYDGQALCGKVETHNSPSAIEPYGGAMTGSGGVFRDILGTGQAAKVISSTDMFCFAPPDLDATLLPQGTLNPDYLQRGVVRGVRDYGNRMGIPTNNGSVHYHEDFRAKPSVIVGAYGILPEERAQKGEVQVHDLVVVMGGRTGRDGIHGATFSSGEMTERTSQVNASAVQIGNAIEEKRMADAIIEARDKGLIRAITDCGAAGFSSAIGEMGEETGVTVDISQAPLKYPGLAPWEIWMSESQERMVLAVAPENREAFMEICKTYNVEATVLGIFDGSGKLHVNYGNQTVADLDYDFLKNGLPQRVMKAHYEKLYVEEVVPDLPTDWVDTVKRVLSHGNVASKEAIVRQYDHTVQGTNVIPPFSGVNYDGPNDAAVIMPILGKPFGMVQSHGMNPILNRIDPYEGSIWAVAEAMANYVAVGGDPQTAALVNNYIWPFPDEEAMGSLDRSVDAVVDAMHALKRPVVSGKDSLSSTYRGKDGEVIKIPPVLAISVFGKIPNVEKTVTADIKRTDSYLYMVGKMDGNMGGSTYYDTQGLVGNEVPKVDLNVLPQVLTSVHEAIVSGEVLSCHDVSEGGLISAVSEMAFGGDCGVSLNLPETVRPDTLLFNETAGTFIVEVADEATAERLFANLPHAALGKTTQQKDIQVRVGDEKLFAVPTDELKAVWQQPINSIFQ